MAARRSSAYLHRFLLAHSPPRRIFPGFQTSRHEPRIQCPTLCPASRFDCSSISIPTYFSKKFASRAAAATTRADDDKISVGPKNSALRKDEKDTTVVYHGPISSTIKKVKLLSLSTCCLSVSLGPVITFMTLPGMNVILKGAMASTVMILSASTTGALHWFVSPYIHELRWRPGSDTFEVEMMSWLATYLTETIKFSDIRPPKTNRPFVTFKANGKFYFVDEEHCHNKALLARLMPRELPHGSAYKNL
ncbi:hypothetical protein KSP39_PZI023700 [Platanthera zijinensis]|uniref:Transmembrane protein 70 n=1 Tax=Platanthera zijinensis TaxID=2320716 RepID=A0AAP0FTM8_9ASPA